MDMARNHSVDMGRLDKYDPSRLADIRRLQAKIMDPSVPEHEKNKVENALYAIRDQAQYKGVQQLREEITKAHMNHDERKIERLTEQAKSMDRNYTN